jgi:putative aminopeptidase FrvX
VIKKTLATVACAASAVGMAGAATSAVAQEITPPAFPPTDSTSLQGGYMRTMGNTSTGGGPSFALVGGSFNNSLNGALSGLARNADIPVTVDAVL